MDMEQGERKWMRRPLALRDGNIILICIADPTLRTPAAVGCSGRSLEHSLLTVTWVSATDIYRWCQRWQSSRFGMPERWSIVRILTTRCERVGRASTIGRPVAAQGARGGYHVRPVRLISLEK
jgi:hypothetical protein